MSKMVVDITRFCRPDLASNFICGICYDISSDPVVHIGGNYQQFCGEVFCSSCAHQRAREFFKQSHNNNKMSGICPISTCDRPFNPPYLCLMVGLAKRLYDSLKYTCLCGVKIPIVGLFSHRRFCTITENLSPSSIVTPSNSAVSMNLSNLRVSDDVTPPLLLFRAPRSIPGLQFKSSNVMSQAIYSYVSRSLDLPVDNFDLVLFTHHYIDPKDKLDVLNWSLKSLVLSVIPKSTNHSNLEKLLTLKIQGSFCISSLVNCSGVSDSEIGDSDVVGDKSSSSSSEASRPLCDNLTIQPSPPSSGQLPPSNIIPTTDPGTGSHAQISRLISRFCQTDSDIYHFKPSVQFGDPVQSLTTTIEPLFDSPEQDQPLDLS